MENGATLADLYRLARAFGQQELLALYNHRYPGYRDLPLLLFEGLSGKLITAVLRPGKRPRARRPR